MEPTSSTLSPNKVNHFHNTTKHALMTALLNGGPIDLGSRKLVIVNAVEREDGSNRSWNVSGVESIGGKSVTLWVKTID